MRGRLREIFDAFIIVIVLQAVMVLVGLLFTAGKGTYKNEKKDLMNQQSGVIEENVVETIE